MNSIRLRDSEADRQPDKAAVAAPPMRRALLVPGFILLLAVIAVYDTFLLGNGHMRLIAPEQLDRAFGSMLRHLLRGDFGVDADAIGFEAFTRNGQTTTYFGIFPALLRLLALPFTDVAQGGLSRLSCLIAMVLFVGLQLRTLWLVHDAEPAEARSATVLTVVAVATCLSGPQLYLLGSATIYHEPVFWAGAMGAAYNLVLLRGVLVRHALSAGDMAVLAGLAVLALNTRASVGAALCLTTGLLVLLALFANGWRGLFGRVLRAEVGWPVLVLAVGVAVAGTVNFERWGSPFSFADFRYYDFAHRQPQRLEMILRYGELNPMRIPIGILYYATGIPYLLKFFPVFNEYFRSHFDGLEAPPFSGLFVNPLTVVLAGVGLWRIVRRPPVLPGHGVMVLRLALIGHAAAIVLVCSAMYLAMRYRMDFAPFMTLAAFIGYPVVMQAARGAHGQAVRTAGIMLCLAGILASHYLLLVHKVWSIGVPMDVRQALLPFAPFARAALQP